MNRRDFICFRTEHATRVVELSCRRLALRDLEWQATRGSDIADLEAVSGEPDASFDGPSVEDAVRQLARDLSADDVLRVTDREWPLAHHLEREVSALVAAHVSRGGRIIS